MIDDFIKFSAGDSSRSDGDYYIAYRNVIDRIVAESRNGKSTGMTITPHIDKRWHYTLRDINDSVYEKNLSSSIYIPIFRM